MHTFRQYELQEVCIMVLVREMPVTEQPREKALRFGVDKLSTRELLALIIRHGVRGLSALDVADRLLLRGKSLHGISKMRYAEITAVPGISSAKALELQACMEIAVRIAYESIPEKDVVKDPESVVNWLRLKLGQRLQEDFLVIYLDSAYHVLSAEVLFTGTGSASLVSSRDIFRRALEAGASAIMLAHNHPGGDPTPSPQDLLVTEEVMDAGRLMNIEVVDHLIITAGGYLSLRREGLMMRAERQGMI